MENTRRFTRSACLFPKTHVHTMKTRSNIQVEGSDFGRNQFIHKTLGWGVKHTKLCASYVASVQQSRRAQLPCLSGFQLGKTPIPETMRVGTAVTGRARMRRFHRCQNWGPVSPIKHNNMPLVLDISLTKKGPYPQQPEIVILKSERFIIYLHATH